MRGHLRMTTIAMSPDLGFLLTLALRMAITAAFVVSASVITERSGPVSTGQEAPHEPQTLSLPSMSAPQRRHSRSYMKHRRSNETDNQPRAAGQRPRTRRVHDRGAGTPLVVPPRCPD